MYSGGVAIAVIGPPVMATFFSVAPSSNPDWPSGETKTSSAVPRRTSAVRIEAIQLPDEQLRALAPT